MAGKICRILLAGAVLACSSCASKRPAAQTRNPSPAPPAALAFADETLVPHRIVYPRRHPALEARLRQLRDPDYFAPPPSQWAGDLLPLYEYILDRFDQPSLYRRQPDSTLREYRLVVLPGGLSQQGPVGVRLFWEGREPKIQGWWFETYAKDGLLSNVIAGQTRRLAPGEVETIQEQLRRSGLWFMPPAEEGPKFFNETHYFFEALEEGRYRCIDRVPDEDAGEFGALGRRLLTAAGLDGGSAESPPDGPGVARVGNGTTQPSGNPP